MLFIDTNTKKLPRKYAAIFILASVYGLMMEFLQLWIRNASRSFEIGDVVANCAGVLCGIIFGYSISPFLVKLLITKPGVKKTLDHVQCHFLW
jgi:glycopeptide antibiotics resistance protein